VVFRLFDRTILGKKRYGRWFWLKYFGSHEKKQEARSKKQEARSKRQETRSVRVVASAAVLKK